MVPISNVTWSGRRKLNRGECGEDLNTTWKTKEPNSNRLHIGPIVIFEEVDLLQRHSIHVF